MKKQERSQKRETRPAGRTTSFRRSNTKPHVPRKKEDDSIRLNKFIAGSGICSRREADSFIEAGLVSVNGKIVTELGTKVSMKDDIRYNGERIKSERLVYILLNKPKDFITTVKDPHATKTVLQLVANACKERVYPVGRLDRNTTGVLLLTNDGDLAKTLTHPRYNKLKIYHVSLDKSLAAKDFNQVRDGVTLEDGFIKVDAISYTDPTDKSTVGIEIHSGKNRIVRRIFEQLDYRIKKLDRVYFAGLTKKGLTRGQWRFLTDKEISMLKMGAYQ
jgi:23S rRNA pseudouridine2605 synthase